MAFEIERKFLIKDKNILKGLQNGEHLIQGYLSLTSENIVRLRVKQNLTAFITIKRSVTPVRKYEYEYEIPVEEALSMLKNICVKPLIEKKRYLINSHGFKWEIDVFEGVFAGIVIAEIELPEEHTPFEKPSWIGDEVTYDPAYRNAEMVRRFRNSGGS